MAKMAENRQTAGNLNWMPKMASRRVKILAKVRQNSVKLVVCLVCFVFPGQFIYGKWHKIYITVRYFGL